MLEFVVRSYLAVSKGKTNTFVTVKPRSQVIDLVKLPVHGEILIGNEILRPEIRRHARWRKVLVVSVETAVDGTLNSELQTRSTWVNLVVFF